MYKIFVIGLVGFMLVSCNKSKSVEIVETYENGEIKIRKTTKTQKKISICTRSCTNRDK